MLDSPWLWITVAVAAVLVVVLGLGLLRRGGTGGRHARRSQPGAAPVVDPTPRRRAVMVVNPTKFTDVAALQARLTAACTGLGWDVGFDLTTAAETGTAQARRAVAEGADVVCALGGDGTVRAVAEGLAGTATPMGLLPGGTGNLLARNLGLPIDNLEDAVRIALTGHDHHIDVGRVTVDVTGDGETTSDHVFLVMAGMGFDAEIMGSAAEDLKARVGWPAYVLTGLRNLRGDRFKVRLTVGDGEPVEQRTRTVVIGNCGRLMAGINLMPQARVDDGLLDALLLSPKGLAGWVAVTGRIARRRTDSNVRVTHFSSPRFVVRTDRAEEVQIDGDHVGAARELRAEVWPGSLIVRADDGAEVL